MPYNVLGAGSASGYEIEQSLRFEDGDSAVLSLTPSTSNRKTFTWSGWIKRGNIPASYMNLFGATDGVSNEFDIRITNSNTLEVGDYTSPSYNFDVITSQVFRDVSSWYHIVVVINTTESTASDRVKIYINGSQVTSFSTASYPSLNYDTYINNSSYPTYIASFSTTANRFDGYMAEVNFIDGQALTPSDFGETDLLTNQWIPKKYVGTYGTNGFYLNFGNSGSLGADSSGNGNNFTPTNLAATDQVLDSPTNNFATLNPLSKLNWLSQNSTVTTSNGNLGFAVGGGGNMMDTTIAVSSGKWYWEVTQSAYIMNGIRSTRGIPTGNLTYYYYQNSGQILYTPYNTTSYTILTTVSLSTSGDIIGIALDLDNRTISWYKNNSLLYTATSIVADEYAPCVGGAANSNSSVINFGQDSSFAGSKTAQNNTDDNGIGDFYYAPPSGYLALCEDNLSDPSIALPGDHFEAVVYVGDGNSTQEVTTSFEPDLIWNKNRTTGYHHRFFDRVRGLDKSVYSNKTSAEDTYQDYGYPTATSSTSVTVGQGTDSGNLINVLSSNYVLWNWKADNTSGSSNTDGTITSTVSANTTAGFSIVSYTGNGSTSPTTVGHGLSIAPNFVIVKRRDAVSDWIIGHDSLATNAFANNKFLKFDTSAVFTNSVVWGSQPTSSVVQITNGSAANLNASGGTYVMYCFHSVEGYSKIGSYTGNGSADGPFVYTGFRPKFILIKSSSNSSLWEILDTARDTYNPVGYELYPNTSGAEGNASGAGGDFDYLSNGFKSRRATIELNTNGYTYIYMAFAESPFKYSNAR